MSIATIPYTSYSRIFSESVARYRRRGYSMADAQRATKDLMDGCFRCDEAELELALQKDSDDEQAGDWTR